MLPKQQRSGACVMVHDRASVWGGTDGDVLLQLVNGEVEGPMSPLLHCKESERSVTDLPCPAVKCHTDFLRHPTNRRIVYGYSDPPLTIHHRPSSLTRHNAPSKDASSQVVGSITVDHDKFACFVQSQVEKAIRGACAGGGGAG